MERQGMKGYTLVEMMAVVAIIGVLGSIAHLSYQDLRARRQLYAAIDMVGADLRKARVTVWYSGDQHHIDFDPHTNSYLLNDLDRIVLPGGVRFGADPAVKGKPSQPNEAPPADGITFKGGGVENRVEFYSKGLVVPTGAVYLTNGKETMAITVSLNGHQRTWRSDGGNKWTLL